MAKKLIEFSDVSIFLKGEYILKDFTINFSEETGVVGLIGLNGAGKTSFIKSIFGYYPISSGSISISTNQIAFCPDVPDFPSDMTTLELLEYSRMIGNKDRKEKEFYQNILNMVGLSAYSDREISNFSRGMKQRLGIASVLVLEPKIIFFDEPTSALDPQGREEIIQILNSLAQNRLVVFSSHILNDVEKIADRIVVIHKGKKLFDDTISKLLTSNEQNILVKVENNSSFKILKKILSDKDISFLQAESAIQICGIDLYDFFNLLNEDICKGIASVEMNRISLEKSFINLIKESEY